MNDKEKLVAEARKLVPTLRDRATAAEAARNVQSETIVEFSRAGLFRVFQPRRWGGLELDPNVFSEIQMTLAEGDMSAAWVYGVLACHSYELALFPTSAQSDVWEKNGSALLCSSYQPVGKVVRAEGGFRLSGRWSFSSGSAHAQWVLLAALVPSDDPEVRTFLVPRDDFRIEDTWRPFGLKATGSNDILVDGAFVPEHRTRSHRAEVDLGADSALYRLPWAQVFLRSVSTSALGAARGAIDAFVNMAKSRVSSVTGKVSKTDPFVMEAAADAAAQVDEMTATLHRNFSDMMAYAERREPIPMKLRTLYRHQSSTVVSRCARLVDDMLPLLGGRVIGADNPLVRTWLDLSAARAHVGNDARTGSAAVFSALMGEDSIPGFH